MGETNLPNHTVKQKVVHELRQLIGIFLYLFVFFTVFRIYTRLITDQYQVSYLAFSLILLKSLALAKVILTGEALGLGRRILREKPLMVTTLYFATVFAAFALLMEILEHLILGWFHHKGASDVFAEIMEKGWPHFVGMTLVVFVAFIPFFAFRETSRVLGEGKLEQLFFKRGHATL
jgi:hypothetical protein